MYKVSYHCTNCKQLFEIEYEVGTPAPDVRTCTNCECETGRKRDFVWSGIRPSLIVQVVQKVV